MVIHKMMYKIDTPHLYVRDGVYYFVGRVPKELYMFSPFLPIQHSNGSSLGYWIQVIKIKFAAIKHFH